MTSVVTLLPLSAYNADLLYWGTKVIGLSLGLLALFFLGALLLVRLQEMRNKLLVHLEELVEIRTEDLNRVNAVLTQSEARLKSVFDNIPDLIWLKDKEGVYLACNRAFEDFFGLHEDSIIGKTDAEWHPGEPAETSRAEDVTIIQKDEPIVVEHWGTHERESACFST